tara:strand:- start:3331 stop:4137 length:807 start_codon:yes stop_codon:yes gene_type:complete
MIILIPMGGKGTRFSQEGYKENKACILTTDRHSGKKLPMVICAMKDIPGIDDEANTIVCIDRDFHLHNGTEEKILRSYNHTIFIHDHVLLDQAFGCFLAREFLNSDEELFIGACDNGMEIDLESFEDAKRNNEALMISHTNDQNIAQNPNAHSWAKLNKDGKYLSELSLKKTVSDNPMNDHATTGMFWFRSAKVFLKFLEEMIWAEDTLEGKYYIDKLLQYYIKDEKKVGFFDVKYICWGTPSDYENYEKTIGYWTNFYQREEWIKKR